MFGPGTLDIRTFAKGGKEFATLALVNVAAMLLISQGAPIDGKSVGMTDFTSDINDLV
tara:strand:+ start:310 stop:483 length:174 start_codon:yes stop_codon:yes gene_type:complete